MAKTAIETIGSTILTPEKILEARRSDDKENTLWNTYNIIQENVIKGGISSVNANGRRTRTRGVNDVYNSVRINKSLWELTENTYERLAA
jgi:hypothetical protein